MSEFSHLRNKLLAEQVEDQIYHYSAFLLNRSSDLRVQ